MTFLNQQLGMKAHMKLVMIMQLEQQILPHLKISLSHRNNHNCIPTSPDGKAHNQIDHILIDRCRHSSVHDVVRD
jgi:hypothetical protein